jgi:predicted nucleic acid-binding protein
MAKVGSLKAEAAARSYKLEVGDCLLAAAALREHCSLFVLARDLRHIPQLKLYRFRCN